MTLFGELYEEFLRDSDRLVERINKIKNQSTSEQKKPPAKRRKVSQRLKETISDPDYQLPASYNKLPQNQFESFRRLLAICDTMHDFLGSRCSSRNLLETFQVLFSKLFPEEQQHITDNFDKSKIEEQCLKYLQDRLFKFQGGVVVDKIVDLDGVLKVIFPGDSKGIVGLIYDSGNKGHFPSKENTKKIDSEEKNKQRKMFVEPQNPNIKNGKYIYNLQPICSSWDKASKLSILPIDIELDVVDASQKMAKIKGLKTQYSFQVLGGKIENKIGIEINNEFYPIIIPSKKTDLRTSVSNLCEYLKKPTNNPIQILYKEEVFPITNKPAFVCDIKRSQDYGQVEFVHKLLKNKSNLVLYLKGKNKIIDETPNIYILATNDRLCYAKARLEQIPVLFLNNDKTFLYYKPDFVKFTQKSNIPPPKNTQPDKKNEYNENSKQIVLPNIGQQVENQGSFKKWTTWLVNFKTKFMNYLFPFVPSFITIEYDFQKMFNFDVKFIDTLNKKKFDKILLKHNEIKLTYLQNIYSVYKYIKTNSVTKIVKLFEEDLNTKWGKNIYEMIRMQDIKQKDIESLIMYHPFDKYFYACRKELEIFYNIVNNINNINEDQGENAKSTSDQGEKIKIYEEFFSKISKTLGFDMGILLKNKKLLQAVSTMRSTRRQIDPSLTVMDLLMKQTTVYYEYNKKLSKYKKIFNNNDKQTTGGFTNIEADEIRDILEMIHNDIDPEDISDLKPNTYFDNLDSKISNNLLKEEIDKIETMWNSNWEDELLKCQICDKIEGKIETEKNANKCKTCIQKFSLEESKIIEEFENDVKMIENIHEEIPVMILEYENLILLEYESLTMLGYETNAKILKEKEIKVFEEVFEFENDFQDYDIDYSIFTNSSEIQVQDPIHIETQVLHNLIIIQYIDPNNNMIIEQLFPISTDKLEQSFTLSFDDVNSEMDNVLPPLNPIEQDNPLPIFETGDALFYVIEKNNFKILCMLSKSQKKEVDEIYIENHTIRITLNNRYKRNFQQSRSQSQQQSRIKLPKFGNNNFGNNNFGNNNSLRGGRNLYSFFQDSALCVSLFKKQLRRKLQSKKQKNVDEFF